MKFFLVVSVGVFAIRTFSNRDAVGNSLDMIAFMTSIGLLITQL
jgi:hypothetical protein